ncbi:hypothetical protein WMY93_010389 [Mugilogobius chulae]|uniref:Uncharacterized protein n=1 Tax=Mugilogobius chulae TaxID=88201 RepID=A0AAW0P8G9_9GOBI
MEGCSQSPSQQSAQCAARGALVYLGPSEDGAPQIASTAAPLTRLTRGHLSRERSIMGKEQDLLVAVKSGDLLLAHKLLAKVKGNKASLAALCSGVILGVA